LLITTIIRNTELSLWGKCKYFFLSNQLPRTLNLVILMISCTISLLLFGEIGTFFDKRNILILPFVHSVHYLKVYGVCLRIWQAYKTLVRLAQSVARSHRVVSGGVTLSTQAFKIGKLLLTASLASQIRRPKQSRKSLFIYLLTLPIL
jgi:uncharacterized membrane protein